MIDRAPGLPDSYAALSVPLIMLNRYDEAEQALQHALNIRETGQALNNLGSIRYSQKRYAKAWVTRFVHSPITHAA